MKVEKVTVKDLRPGDLFCHAVTWEIFWEVSLSQLFVKAAGEGPHNQEVYRIILKEDEK